MSFFDHIEELRWHIIRSIASVLVFAIIAFVNKHFIFDVVFLGPYHTDFWTYRKLCELGKLLKLGDDMCVKNLGFKLINTEMAGQFSQHIGISLTIGIVFAFPYAAWELWRFFKPALSAKERNYTNGIVAASTALFLTGIAFGYYMITPITIQFLGSYSLSDTIVNTIQISDYISTVTMTTFSIALTFELPIVVYFLAKAGILTPKVMREYRRHAIVIILILAAVLTPSTDMLTMTLVGVPFYILYELSIFVAYIVARNKQRKKDYEDSIS
jgi:sec-independent protein translocase protein TatC